VFGIVTGLVRYKRSKFELRDEHFQKSSDHFKIVCRGQTAETIFRFILKYLKVVRPKEVI